VTIKRESLDFILWLSTHFNFQVCCPETNIRCFTNEECSKKTPKFYSSGQYSYSGFTISPLILIDSIIVVSAG
jgi:hypothetical protein